MGGRSRYKTAVCLGRERANHARCSSRNSCMLRLADDDASRRPVGESTAVYLPFPVPVPVPAPVPLLYEAFGHGANEQWASTA